AIGRTQKASNSIRKEQKQMRRALSHGSSDNDFEVINPLSSHDHRYSHSDDDTTSEDHSNLVVSRPFFNSSQKRNSSYPRSKSKGSHDDDMSTLSADSHGREKTTPRTPAARVSAVLGRAKTIEDVRDDIAVAVHSDPQYSNTISKDRKSVKLATTTPPPKTLIDAEIDKVKVFRRLIEDSRMLPKERATLILQSMGIPPRKDSGLELPEHLIINNKNSYAELETTLSKDGNEVMLEVAKEMFTQFETIKNTLGYDDDTSSISTFSNP
ncbi:MAG: hypothetical protein WCO51_12950, partial [bacterium]